MGWTVALAGYGRFQRVTMQNLVEVGAKWFCWLRPNEVMQTNDARDLPTQPHGPYGGFVFLFHDNVLSVDEVEVALDCYFPLTASGAVEALSPRPLGPFRAYTLVDGHPYPECSEKFATAPHQKSKEAEMGISNNANVDSDQKALPVATLSPGSPPGMTTDSNDQTMNNKDVIEASSSHADVAAH